MDRGTEDVSRIVLDQADRLFREQATKERMAQADRGPWPAALWQAIEAAGLPLALVHEVQGGVGLDAASVLRLIRRSGYHTLPVPLAESMIGAALWAEASGEILEGSLSLAPCNASDSVRTARSGEGHALRGTLRRVPWGAQVQHILLHARAPDGSTQLVLLPAGRASAQPRHNLAGEPRDTLSLDGVVLPSSAVRPAPKRCAAGLLAFGALIRAQQLAGAMERGLDYALTYAQERKQFGRPIGKFQAIQHMLAEAAGQHAAATAAADLAIDAWNSDDFVFAVAVAKARAGEAAGKVAEVVHQVHGAMGFTQEHPLHFATRRLWSWRDEFGADAYWQEEIGRQVCAAGGAALWPRLAGA
jgi:acyl-CoA dehydrogenase